MEGNLNNSLNWVQTPLYDTYTLAAAQAIPATITFFDTPASATKGRHLTNLSKQRQLVNPEQFIMSALRVVPVGMDEADIIALMKNYRLLFSLDRKEQLEAPIEFWPGGAGVSGAATTTAATTTIKQWCNGLPSPGAVNLFGIDADPRIGDTRFFIDSETTIDLQLMASASPGNSVGAIHLRIYLDGYHGKKIG